MNDLDRNKFFKKAGIYLIADVKRSRYYVGSTNSLYKRINGHKNELLKGVHHNNFMQAHVNKYGIESLTVEILKTYNYTPTPQELLKDEQHYLDIYYDKTTCFNSHSNIMFFMLNPKIRNLSASRMRHSWKNNYDELRSKVIINLEKAIKIKKEKMASGELVLIAHNKGKKATKELREKLSIAAKNRGRHESITVSIYKYDLNGIFIEEFSCIRDAARCCSNSPKSAANLRDCALGNRNKAYKYIWKFYKKESIPLNYCLININNDKEIQFLTIKDIATYLKSNSSMIRTAYLKSKLIFNKYKIIRNE